MEASPFRVTSSFLLFWAPDQQCVSKCAWRAPATDSARTFFWVACHAHFSQRDGLDAARKMEVRRSLSYASLRTSEDVSGKSKRKSFQFGEGVASNGLERASCLSKVPSVELDVGGLVKRERLKLLWQEFFEGPEQWVDNRRIKKSPQHPDFKHKRKPQALWIDNKFNPRWIKTKLAVLAKEEDDVVLSPGLVCMVPSRVTMRTDVNLEDAEEVRRLCEEGRLQEALYDIEVINLQGSVNAAMEKYWHLLQGCTKMKSLVHVSIVHSSIDEAGFGSSRYLGNALVNSYAQCGSLAEALSVFNKLSQRTVISWTALISGHAKSGEGLLAVELYRTMQREGVKPNSYTFVAILQACARTGDLEHGKRVHAEAVCDGLESDLFVGTALVDMYVKCGSMADAQGVFDRMARHDVVSWTAMITGYSQEDQGDKALQLYAQMQEEGLIPDAFVFASVLRACSSLAVREEATLIEGKSLKFTSLQKGRDIHAEVVRMGHESDPIVGTSMIDMYSKCGSMVEAQRAFDASSKTHVGLWNALIRGYTERDQCLVVLQLHSQMRSAGVKPDGWTFPSLLRACISLLESEDSIAHGSVLPDPRQAGQEIHAEIIREGYESDIVVGNALVQMYAKCGNMVDAQLVFDSLSQPDPLSWKAMAAGYAQQGQIEKAQPFNTGPEAEGTGQV